MCHNGTHSDAVCYLHAALISIDMHAPVPSHNNQAPYTISIIITW